MDEPAIEFEANKINLILKWLCCPVAISCEMEQGHKKSSEKLDLDYVGWQKEKTESNGKQVLYRLGSLVFS